MGLLVGLCVGAFVGELVAPKLVQPVLSVIIAQRVLGTSMTHFVVKASFDVIVPLQSQVMRWSMLMLVEVKQWPLSMLFSPEWPGQVVQVFVWAVST